MKGVFSQVVPKASFDGSDPTQKSIGSSLALVVDDGSEPLLQDRGAAKKMSSEDGLGQHSDSAALYELKQNSTSLTIFLLINTMIGSGILNQPFVFRESGIFGGLLGYLLASLMTWVGLNLLTAAGTKTGILEYGNLAKAMLGRKGELAIDLTIVFGCFGSLLGYILVVGSTLSGLITSWGCNSEACNIYYMTGISILVFVTPICLLRHFGHLAILSVFSVFAIVCVLLLVIIGGPLLAKSGAVTEIDIDGTYRSFGSIVFSLSCASANFQAYITTEKSSQNEASWMWITFWVVLIGSLMCISMGIAGYFSFKDETAGIILDNFHGHKFDFFKLMVACHLIVYIPVNFIIMRYSMVKLWLAKKSEDLSTPFHHSLSVVMLAVTTLFVLLFYYVGLSSGKAFSIVLNITGGISGSISSFGLPSLIYLYCLKEPSEKTGWLYWAAWANLVLGVMLMVSVLVNTILEFV